MNRLSTLISNSHYKRRNSSSIQYVPIW